MTLCRSDVLGPVVSVYKAKGFEEGLLLANDIDCSASSSIWTANINKAMEFSRRSLGHATYIHTDASVEGSNPAAEPTEVEQPHDMLMEVEQMTHLKSVALQLPAKPQIKGSMRMCV